MTKPAYIKFARTDFEDPMNNWITIVDAATEEEIGEGNTIMAAFDDMEPGYQVLGYDQAMAMVGIA